MQRFSVTFINMILHGIILNCINLPGPMTVITGFTRSVQVNTSLLENPAELIPSRHKKSALNPRGDRGEG